jgi:hypothetical protein
MSGIVTACVVLVVVVVLVVILGVYLWADREDV